MKGEEVPWYKEFFGQGYLDTYEFDSERTLREVDFVEEALALPRGSCILDLCCGHGRHLVELAARGYEMMGLDLNRLFLELAQGELDRRGLKARLIHVDMREIPLEGEIEAAINLFTSFGYLESDEEDMKVLWGVARAVKPGGKFLIDTMGRDRLVRIFQPRGWHETEGGFRVLEKREFDPLRGGNFVEVTRIAPDGSEERVWHWFRTYTLTELAKMLERAGLAVKETYGGYDGSPHSLESRRMMILAEKRGEE